MEIVTQQHFCSSSAASSSLGGAHQSCVLSSASSSSYSSSVLVCRRFSGLRATPQLQCMGLPILQCRGKARIVCAVGDVSAEGTNYLIAGAIAVALIGSAYPLLFSRKDLCPECDGAGFIRKTGSPLSANAARKDQAQIVCPNCKGLGKLGQVDK